MTDCRIVFCFDFDRGYTLETPGQLKNTDAGILSPEVQISEREAGHLDFFKAPQVTFNLQSTLKTTI